MTDAILTEPRARATDPQTSHDAAEQAKDMPKKHHDLIVDALRCKGPMGKDGIAAHTWIDGVAVCRRLKELQRLGRIKPTGKTVSSMSGRQEREWSLN